MNELFLPNLHQLGENRGRGNMLGIAPYVVPQDYASTESFFKKLDSYLSVAQREKWLSDKTIVVFPEYIGTWLVLAGESATIFQAESLRAAEQALVLRRPLKFGAFWVASKEQGRTEAAFFRMKANQMAEIYQEVFSRLAREYSITLVAGSIILPSPQISSRRLILTDGPLRNVSVIYQPDGAPYPHPIYKAFLTEEEQPFLGPAYANDIPSFDTPAGRLGVLICADSWYPQAYIPLKEQGVALLAVPSYSGDGIEKWNQPWPGYNGWPVPRDVDVQDIKNLTEAQAWGKYSLGGRIHSSGATYGVRVFLRGKLWDMDLGGWSGTLVRDGEVFVEEPTHKAAMLNLWL